MRKNRTLGLGLGILLCALPACSDDEDSSGTSGAGGAAGMAGMAGSGGAAGSGGSAGAGGMAGSGGTGGTAGMGGMGGEGGMTGLSHVNVTLNDVTGAEGQILLIFVDPQSGPGGIRGGACAPVDSDPFSFTGPARQLLADDDPCMLGDPVEFEAGTYRVSAGTYVPGSMDPGQCSEAEVVVPDSGPADVTLPALGACDMAAPDGGVLP